jgi:hypothetical protein
VTLYDPASLQVRCDVPLRDAAKLVVGMRAEIRVDALPDRVFTGSVVRIVPLGDVQKNTVQCKVAIESPAETLRPDMLARVRLVGGATSGSASSEGVIAPAEAIRLAEGDRAEVVVAVPEGRAARAERRVVAVGPARENGWVEIIDGLHAGDRVGVDAAVEPGERIAPVESLKGDAP